MSSGFITTVARTDLGSTKPLYHVTFSMTGSTYSGTGVGDGEGVGVDVGDGVNEGSKVPSSTDADDEAVSGDTACSLLQADAADTTAIMPVKIKKISSLSARIFTPQICLQLIFIISLFLL